MVSTWLLLARTWTRAALQYPATLAMLSAGVVISTSLDLLTIVIVFLHVPRFGGFEPAGVMYLYGGAHIAFALSNVLIGSADRLGEHIRTGNFDTMLIRPVHPLVQLATEDFSPRKVARLVPSCLVLGWGISRLDLSPGDLLLTALMIVNGTVLFCALWVLAAAAQFVLLDAAQATHVITWGGEFTVQYPMSLYAREFLYAVTFVVPLAFVNWQPSLYVLGVPDPLGLPGFVRFLGPVATALLCLVAAAAWRTGLRHYRSTGS
ncbi:ABC transporter permease [Actinocorallia populi]|uniref:ABC transporter permease n=1 Tax=Actinocorallia populi TaxID=2079200 RepID=UPI001E52A54E|nr:ABC-2 family transporter protein [Actinocorallia populi]